MPPRRVLDPLEGRQLRARPDEAPVRADLLVQRHVGGRVGEGADDLADAPRAPRRSAAPSSPGCAPPRSPARRASPAPRRRRWPRAADQARRCSAPAAASSRRRARPARHRLEVEEHGADVDARRSRRPSRGGSWSGSRSGRARGPAPATAPRAAWSGRAAARRRGPASRFSSSSPPGSGSAGVADVVGEVEVDVVRPQRPARLQRRHDEALAEARHLVEPPAHVLDQVDVARRRPLEDQDRADVHVARRRLVGQERGVDGGQAVEMVCRWCSWCKANLPSLPCCAMVANRRPPPRSGSCSPRRAATAPASTAPCRRSSARSTSTGRPVYVRKEIVHNKHVVEELAKRGAIFVEEETEVPEGEMVVFSAHGVAPAVHENAAARGLRTIDATCPLVTKVHVEARRFAADGYTIVLIGHEGHEEVEGTTGEAPDEHRPRADRRGGRRRSRSPTPSGSPSSPRRPSRSTRRRRSSPPCAPSSRRSSAPSPTTSVTRRPTARSRSSSSPASASWSW